MPRPSSTPRARARPRGVSPLRPGLALLAGLAGLLLAACSLAGDVTPPPGFRPSATPGSAAAAATPQVASTPVDLSQAVPAAQPAALDGGYLYLDHCSPCHGDKGSGGGSMSAQLPVPVPDFSTPDVIRQRTPRELFTTITEGRQDVFMPPFASSLSDLERWSLVAFLYTLSTPSDRLDSGQAVYGANCASCHGQAGKGDGPQAGALPSAPPDLTDPAFAAARSQQDYFDLVSGGDAQHPFKDSLTDDQRWASVDYARAFSYAYSPPEQVTAERDGTVTGRVVNQTAGAAVPADLQVSLHSFEGQTLITTLTTTVNADGAFQFDHVAYKAGRQFVASTTYHDVSYSSPAAGFTASSGTLNLELPVYETTVDPASLSVDQVHMFLEFTSATEMTVGELFIFSNNGDKTFSADASGPLRFDLPEGASNLNVQDAVEDQTFFKTDKGFSLLWSVPPGSGSSQVLFSFTLPYADKASFAQPVQYSISNVNVLVSDLGVKLQGPNIQNMGVQSFQGQSFQNYTSGALASGQTLAFDVTGKPGTGASAPATSLVSDRNGLAIGLAAVAVVLVGLGVWLFRRTPARAAAAEQSREDLLQAIAELDEDYEAGQVGEAEYQREREWLKAELRKKW